MTSTETLPELLLTGHVSRLWQTLASSCLSHAQNARETLENAIRMVEGHPTWDAHVVYGDTDSLFVQLPGRCAPLCSDGQWWRT